MSVLPHSNTAPLVRVDRLAIRFGEQRVPAVRDISFSIRRGECLALIGESGSGKSVTSRSLVGLSGRDARVTANRLHFDGQDLLACQSAHWRQIRGAQIGFVMQDALGSLDPLRPMGREVDEPLKLHTELDKSARAARVLELLRSVGVPEPELRALQYPHQLSGGMRQRALIASAIACQPKLLIADEPTTALDAAVQTQVLDLLQSLRSPDNAMLLVSHDFGVVARLADRVAVMRHGEILEMGTLRQIMEDPQHAYTKSLLSAVVSIHSRKHFTGSQFGDISVDVPAANAPRIDSEYVIEASGLSKAFVGPDGKSRQAVSNLSFTLRPGETLGIVGESGSGKTTTKRMVLGLLEPDRGSVKLLGHDWATLSGAQKRSMRKRVQVVFQDPMGSFDPRYTVERVIGEALSVAGYAKGPARLRRTVELLQLVRLNQSYLGRRPIELSGGQRQRVAIARALAAEPDVLLCDEPVSALDVSVQAQILDLLFDLKERLKIACVFISHDLGIVYRVSDRVLVMKDGEVVESGPIGEVFNHPQHSYTKMLLNCIPHLPGQEELVRYG